MTKAERLAIFQQRLSAAPPSTTFEEALTLIETTLTDVENEFSEIPASPEGSRTDGRLYPPQADNIHEVKGNARVRRLRSAAHETFIGNNGAIEIRLFALADAIFNKPGADGSLVSEL